MSDPGTVYLLHFEPRYRHAGHYIGWTPRTPEERLDDHLAGRGGRLPHVAHMAGCRVTIARTWSGSRRLERRLKSYRCAPKYCPICRGVS